MLNFVGLTFASQIYSFFAEAFGDFIYCNHICNCLLQHLCHRCFKNLGQIILTSLLFLGCLFSLCLRSALFLMWWVILAWSLWPSSGLPTRPCSHGQGIGHSFLYGIWLEQNSFVQKFSADPAVQDLFWSSGWRQQAFLGTFLGLCPLNFLGCSLLHLPSLEYTRQKQSQHPPPPNVASDLRAPAGLPPFRVLCVCSASNVQSVQLCWVAARGKKWVCFIFPEAEGTCVLFTIRKKENARVFDQLSHVNWDEGMREQTEGCLPAEMNQSPNPGGCL